MVIFPKSGSAETISYRPNCQITRLVHISPLTKMIPLILENFNFVLKKFVKKLSLKLFVCEFSNEALECFIYAHKNLF